LSRNRTYWPNVTEAWRRKGKLGLMRARGRETGGGGKKGGSHVFRAWARGGYLKQLLTGKEG